MNTKILMAVGVVGLIILGALYYSESTETTEDNYAPVMNTEEDSQPQQTTDTSETSIYTMDEVKQHGDANSCWTAVNGNVYDVTSFISQHPGGERNILKICGADGTSAFMHQHGSTGTPASILASFQIGTLAE